MDTEDALAEAIRVRIEQWLRDHSDKSAADLARLAKITPTQVSTVRSRKRGAGMKTIRGLSMAMGVSLSQLESEAQNIIASRPEPRVVKDERYPNRGAAEVYSRAKWRDDPLLEAAIAAVRQHALLGQDLEVDDWIDRVRLKRAELATRDLALPKGDKLVPIVDDEPPKEAIPKHKPKGN